MSWKLLVIVLITHFSSFTLVSKDKIVISGRVPEKYRNDSVVEVSFFPINYVDLENERVTHSVKVEKGYVKWVYEADFPIVLSASKLFGTEFNYLLEPGDSIYIQAVNNQIFITGRGMEKIEILRASIDLKIQRAISRRVQDVKSKEEYLEVCRTIDSLVNEKRKFLKLYKNRISSFAYRHLESYIISNFEREKINGFLSLYNYKRKGKVGAEMLELFNASLKNSIKSPVALDSANPSTDLMYFLFSHTMAECTIKNYTSYDSSSNSLAKKRVQWYYQAKKMYRGLVREKLLSYIITSWLIKRTGFQPDVEMALSDYFSLPGYGEYKKWVRAYEKKARILTRGKRAPNFALFDVSDNEISLDHFKGKVLLLDFWFSGCSGCVQMNPILRKIEDSFRNNSNTVFLSISMDASKERWLRSIKEGKYTTGRSLNLHTNGQGYSHSIVKNYSLSSFPTLYLIDAYGRIVTNPLPDPRKDDGVGLISTIQREVNKLHDGPYVLYESNRVVVKYVTADDGRAYLRSDTIGLAESEDLMLRVYTDVMDKYFNVKLRGKLYDEPCEFNAVNRQFVISDIEGNFDSFRTLLQANGVIDSSFNWTFGDGHLVLIGDFFDRGAQVTECLWLIYLLEGKSRESGGYVHFILGNHEIMNLQNDLRYVNDKYWLSMKLMGVDNRFLYGVTSELGRWLRTKNVMERIGRVLYVHGGVSSEVNGLPLSLKGINDAMRPFYSLARNVQENSLWGALFKSKTSPFWYRDYYDEVPATINQQIDSTLSKFGVDRIVTGHTLVETNLAAYHNNKIINVDTKHADGMSEALLIENGIYYKVNSQGERKELFNLGIPIETRKSTIR